MILILKAFKKRYAKLIGFDNRIYTKLRHSKIVIFIYFLCFSYSPTITKKYIKHFSSLTIGQQTILIEKCTELLLYSCGILF